MTGDMPTIANSAYGSSTSVFALSNNGFVHGGLATDITTLTAGLTTGPVVRAFQPAQNNPVNKKEKPAMTARRLVQVFIADPDENVPLEKSMLYTGEQKLTDATDQELFFEIEIKAILDKHNAERVTMVNKKVKERVENLEPAKIRDLKMVVVNVATF